MKSIALSLKELCWISALALLPNPTVLGQTPAPPTPDKPKEYDQAAERGPHHRRVEWVSIEKDATGKLVPKTHRYIQLANNLHYLENGQWKESEEKIEPYPRGAAALKGAYTAIFGKNLNRAGAIEVALSDGRKVRNNPVGLYYYDRASGRWVKLSAVKDSVGEILSPNQVIYRDAFESLRADMIYKYQRGKFEADVVLRERPAPPSAYGLNDDTTVLEMVTEFSAGPEPQVKEHVLKQETDAQKRIAMATPDIVDQELEFAGFTFVLGTAYSLTESGGNGNQNIPIAKRWLQDGARRILSEQVEYSMLKPMLAQLSPAVPANQTAQDGARAWPAAASEAVESGPMQTAASNPQAKGVVLDYSGISGSYSSLTFYGGTTYWVTGDVTISGAATIQGGTVIKYNSGKYISVAGSITGPTSTAYFTAVDDHTVGEQLTSATLSGTYASTALDLYYLSSGAGVTNLEIRHANTAISVAGSSYSYTFANARIIYCNTGFTAGSGPYVTVTDPCFNNVGTHYNNIYSHSGDTTCANYPPILTSVNTLTGATEDTAFTITYATLAAAANEADAEGSAISFRVESVDSGTLTKNGSAVETGATLLGSGEQLVWTPAANANGTLAAFSVRAWDGSDASATAVSVNVSVAAVNDPPTISTIAPRELEVGKTSRLIGFYISDVETSSGSLSVSASTDRSDLIPTITTNGTGAFRTVQLTANQTALGIATITIAVSDGVNTSYRDFSTTVTSDPSNPDTPPGGPTRPGGSAGGAGGAGAGSFFGPCGEVDLEAIKRKLHVEWDDLQCNSGTGGFVVESEPVTFGDPVDCPNPCAYKVEVTFAANLGIAGANDDYSAAQAWGLAPELRLSGLGTALETCPVMQSTSVTYVATVTHGTPLSVGLGVYNYSPLSGWGAAPVAMGMENPWAKITKLEIKSVGWTGEGCTSEDGLCTFDTYGNPEPLALGSVDMGYNLSRSLFGRAPVKLRLFSEQPTPIIATAQALSRTAIPDASIDVVRTSPTSGIRQVRSPKGLLDIVTTNATKYYLRFYGTNGIGNGGIKDTNGLYVTNGTPPLRNYEVCNPTGSTNTPNCLCITDLTASLTNQYDYFPVGTDPAMWQLARGNGLRFHKRQYQTNGTERTETTSTHSASNSPAIRKVQEKFKTLTFGDALVEKTADPDGAQLKATYTYYTNTADNGYGKIKQTIFPDGNWEIAEYGTNKLVSRLYSSFLNQDPTTNASLCRKIEYDYTPISGSGDTGAYRPQLPRQETEYVLGNEVRRKYYVFKRGEKHEIVCVAAGATWNDANNLVIVTKRLMEGFFRDELQSVKRPDGTLELYEYATNSAFKTTTVWLGQPGNTNYTNVIAGTKTITIVGIAGQMMTNSVYDIASGLLTDQQIYSDYDEQQRPRRVTFLDGTFTQTTYGCCGPDSVQQRDGTTISYTYDALKRKKTETLNGVTMIYDYDAANRVIKTTRQGTNGTQIVLSQTGYDMAGRVIGETNAVGVATTYAYTTDGQSQSVKTITYAAGTSDSATRIETYAKDGTLVKVTGTAVPPIRYDFGVEQDGGVNRLNAKEIKLDTNYNDTVEWKKTYRDFAGREYKTLFADNAYEQVYFNTLGQVWKQRDADGVVTLHEYDAEGQRFRTAIDVNVDNTINTNGLDRVTQTLADVLSNYSTTVRRTRTYEWPTDNNGANVLTRTVETSADGLRTWTSAYGLTNTTMKTVPSLGAWLETNAAPDGSKVISSYTSGRLAQVTRQDSASAQLGQTTYTYDVHGRQASVTDARNGPTTYGYDNADRVTSVMTPPPGNGQASQTTTTYFDNRGRAWRTVQPDGTSLTNEYFAIGALKKTYGSRTYPVEYTYDAQGRVKTMKTWQNFASGTGAATTTWNYEQYRGFLASKRYADNTGPDYTYTGSGRLKTRTWARTGTGGQRIVTTYKYGFDDGTSNNDHGDLVETSYSNDPQSTTTVAAVHDRRGRQKTITQGSMTTTMFYNDASQLIGEGYSGGTLSGLAITNLYDSHLRRSDVLAKNGGTTLSTATYGYDGASRLTNVTDGTYSAGYVYLANSPLVNQITFKQSSTVRMTTTKQYDLLNRLTSISSSSSISYAYAYNDANQRTRLTLADGSYWLYDYDALGQVKSGKRYWADNTPVAGQQFEYAHDDIGNRTSTKAGGDSVGASLRLATYSANSLNQYINRTVPSGLDILGIANVAASVTVNSQTTYRKGEYYHKALTVANSSAPVFQSVTNTAANGGSTSNLIGNIFVPAATENFTNDLDGNLNVDGRWTFTWDAENRLVKLEANSNVPDAAKRKLEFEYDHRARRISKKVYTWNGSSYALQTTTRFLYDGWNLLTELDGNNALVRSYMWGLDLSGGLQGAGGVGGLLSMKPSGGAAHFAAYDGSGNVTTLVDGSSGTASANYEYSPFGETIRITGAQASANKCRFSTKYTDDESDFLYYGYRLLNASTGRWLSRDPIGEKGGVNLCSFVRNNPNRSVDPLGNSFWDYVPIIATIRCCMTQPGENIQDYANISVDTAKCQTDPDAAEQACEAAIDARARAYATAVVGPGVPKTIIDIIFSSVGLIPHPATKIAGGVLLVDGIVGVACMVDSIGDIGSSAVQAKANQCKCPNVP